MRETEPQRVQQAREVIRAWELRNGHNAYVDCLHGGWHGFQAACWDCDWRGKEQLRDRAETMGTEASRSHKRNANSEAAQHRKETVPSPDTLEEK